MHPTLATNSIASRALRRCCIIATVCGLATGCSGNRPVQAEVLLSHNNCQTLNAGVTEIAMAQIARIRGSRLLRHPAAQQADDESLATGTTLSAPTSSTPTLSAATRVFAISRGSMPTPGYSMALHSAELADTTLTVRVDWEQPAADAVLAQQLTHPCMVVALPVAEASTLVVRANDTEIGRVAL
ncbi:MAG: protease complex subunit PrcB family protein [Pseudomonadales bacterium]